LQLGTWNLGKRAVAIIAAAISSNIPVGDFFGGCRVTISFCTKRGRPHLTDHFVADGWSKTVSVTTLFKTDYFHPTLGGVFLECVCNSRCWKASKLIKEPKKKTPSNLMFG